MALIQLAQQTKPSSPAASNNILYAETTSNEFVELDSSGNAKMLRVLTNANTADQSSIASNTYITGSAITVPPTLMRVGATFTWNFFITKTGTGTATPTWLVKTGTLGTTSDTTRLTFT